jgi:mono/diheme cytochrome c family protein
MVDFFYRVLAALGYQHPVHVLFTHMPIGLVTGAFFLMLVALLFRKQNLQRSARHVFILALVFAVPTVIFGVMDWIHFYNGAWLPAIKAKIILASILLALLVAGAILGRPGKAGSPVMLVIYILSFLTVVGLGYFGGNLVFGESSSSAAPSRTNPPRLAVSPEDLQAGAAIFAANCQACHPQGRNVVVPSLPIRTSRRLASVDTFTAFIRDPKMPDGSPGNMPPFSKGDIPDAAAGRLYAYLVDMTQTAWR